MQTMTVSQFKSHFPGVLDLVQHGEDIVISYGKKKGEIAELVPFATCHNALFAAKNSLWPYK